MAIDRAKAINPMDLIPRKLQEPEQPVLSPEEALEQEILQQADAVQIQVRAANDPFQNIVYIAVESATLGQKVATEFDYIEETENGVAIGRSLNGARKQILTAGAEVAAIQPHVVAQRQTRG